MTSDYDRETELFLRSIGHGEPTKTTTERAQQTIALVIVVAVALALLLGLTLGCYAMWNAVTN